jgi:hypothetical protein
MLLVSRDTELKMFAELVHDDLTVENKEESLSFVLDEEFTDNHQISLVVADSQRKHAIFVTESYIKGNKYNRNPLIDYVTLLKIVLGADKKLSYKQMSIPLPEQQVRVKVICSLSENSNDILCYFFF